MGRVDAGALPGAGVTSRPAEASPSCIAEKRTDAMRGLPRQDGSPPTAAAAGTPTQNGAPLLRKLGCGMAESQVWVGELCLTKSLLDATCL